MSYDNDNMPPAPEPAPKPARVNCPIFPGHGFLQTHGADPYCPVCRAYFTSGDDPRPIFGDWQPAPGVDKLQTLRSMGNPLEMALRACYAMAQGNPDALRLAQEAIARDKAEREERGHPRDGREEAEKAIGTIADAIRARDARRAERMAKQQADERAKWRTWLKHHSL